MRLTPHERQIIRDAGLRHFGVVPYLFGSRLNDAERGGDIDLFIPGEWSTEDAVPRRIRFCADIGCSLGDRKLDVVIGRKERRPIQEWAEKHGEAV